MHRAVPVEQGYFSPLISGVAGLGCCPLCLDKDAVCGPLLGAFVVACVRRPDPNREGGVNVSGALFIHSLPQFNLVNTGISQAIFMAGCYDQQYPHLVL